MKYRTFFFLCSFAAFLLQAQVELVVLGTAQDAGAPQIGCEKVAVKQDGKREKKKLLWP